MRSALLVTRSRTATGHSALVGASHQGERIEGGVWLYEALYHPRPQRPVAPARIGDHLEAHGLSHAEGEDLAGGQGLGSEVPQRADPGGRLVHDQFPRRPAEQRQVGGGGEAPQDLVDQQGLGRRSPAAQVAVSPRAGVPFGVERKPTETAAGTAGSDHGQGARAPWRRRRRRRP